MQSFVWHKDQKAVCHCLASILDWLTSITTVLMIAARERESFWGALWEAYPFWGRGIRHLGHAFRMLQDPRSTLPELGNVSSRLFGKEIHSYLAAN